jgi:hypothetical protein
MQVVFICLAIFQLFELIPCFTVPFFTTGKVFHHSTKKSPRFSSNTFRYSHSSQASVFPIADQDQEIKQEEATEEEIKAKFLKENDIKLSQLQDSQGNKFHEILQGLSNDEQFKEFLSKQRKRDFFDILETRYLRDNSDDDLSFSLRSLAPFLSIQCDEDKTFLNRLIAEYFNTNTKSPVTFAIFLTALRKLHFSWEMMDSSMKQKLLINFDYIVKEKEVQEGQCYSEILQGVCRLGIPWSELSIKGRGGFFSIFKAHSQQWSLPPLIVVLNHFNKLNSPETHLTWEQGQEILLGAITFLEKGEHLEEKISQVFFSFVLFLSFFPAILLLIELGKNSPLFIFSRFCRYLKEKILLIYYGVQLEED